MYNLLKKLTDLSGNRVANEGLVDPHNYDSDWDYYDALNAPSKRRSGYSSRSDDTVDMDPPSKSAKPDGISYKFDKEAEGVAPNGQRYNLVVTISGPDETTIAHKVQLFKDHEWGAKEVVDTKASSDGTPGITLFVVNNHKYGHFKPWKDENATNEGTDMNEITLESLRLLSGMKAPIAECGMSPVMDSMGGGSGTPASISATAGSGPELSAMLKDIMSLAGLKQVGQNDMPADIGPSKVISAPPMAGVDPMRSMMDIIDGDDDVAEPAAPDSMNNDEMGGNGADGKDDGIDTGDGDEVEDEGLLGTMAGSAAGAALGGPLGAAVGGAAGDAITGKEEESRNPEYLNSPKEKSLPNPVSRLGDVNQGDHRERQKGLPQGNPQTTAESLLADYKKFVIEESKKPSAGMTTKEKSSLAKKASAGKDIGKPGKNFEKVAKKAGGGEKGKKIAAAAMWKNAAKK